MLVVWELDSRPGSGRRGRERQNGRIWGARGDYGGVWAALERKIAAVHQEHEEVLTVRSGCIAHASSDSLNMASGGRTFDHHHQQQPHMIRLYILTLTRLTLQREQPCLDLLWWTIDGILMVGVELELRRVMEPRLGPWAISLGPRTPSPKRPSVRVCRAVSQPRSDLTLDLQATTVRNDKVLMVSGQQHGGGFKLFCLHLQRHANGWLKLSLSLHTYLFFYFFHSPIRTFRLLHTYTYIYDCTQKCQDPPPPGPSSASRC